uniref:Forkhead box protein N3 n=1 Tax=Timema monikensis TaxID=170555 RepID=A0A7R9HJ32_9NEOP|nr:unnamed protein product [Timema monikensis]
MAFYDRRDAHPTAAATGNMSENTRPPCLQGYLPVHPVYKDISQSTLSTKVISQSTLSTRLSPSPLLSKRISPSPPLAMSRSRGEPSSPNFGSKTPCACFGQVSGGHTVKLGIGQPTTDRYLEEDQQHSVAVQALARFVSVAPGVLWRWWVVHLLCSGTGFNNQLARSSVTWKKMDALFAKTFLCATLVELLVRLMTVVRSLQEGDAAGNILTTVRVEKAGAEDDDLTSLSWLQDKNLLKACVGAGINLQVAVGEAQELPTSDFVDDSASEVADSTCSSGNSLSPLPSSSQSSSPSKLKHPQHMPYDPLIHVHSKPPYSFSCLIFMAIEDSPSKALPVKEIYSWILDHFPYFCNAPTGWKNSVRHNLSLNKCFRKVEKAPVSLHRPYKLPAENLGKGSLWMVDPVYRPNLVQALKKAPFHPYSSLERVSVSNKSRSPGSPHRTEVLVAKGNTRLPNPDLFPFLSRRLAASTADTTCLLSDMTPDDDVNAAAAMLALKHGNRMIAQKRAEWFRRIQVQDDSTPVLLDLRKKKTRASKTPQGGSNDQMIPVITTSPSEDHTYSAGRTFTSTPAQQPLATTSPDEAFEEGSESNEGSSLGGEPRPVCLFPNMSLVKGVKSSSSSSDTEEQRKIAEGADALLNLAGISTRKRSHSQVCNESYMYIACKRDQEIGSHGEHRKFTRICMEGEHVKPFRENHPRYTQPGSNHDLMGKLFYCESDVLDHLTTEAVICKLFLINKAKQKTINY